ncbi:MAG: (d)CMP kinase [Muribaculaceae bacterium]|nr:(d)CMP kinase [Muribaculaceae bacterium]
METERIKITVAIDGFSSSGKSTMARRLASAVGYRYIDSGAMYRAVALFGLDNGFVSSDGDVNADALVDALPRISIDFVPQPDGSQHTTLNGVDVESQIRQLRVSNVVSPVAAIPAVRHRLVAMQQAFGVEKGIVMDGRDIGTTVFPDAELKIYVDASAETRAQRRFKELVEKGSAVTYEEVLANVVHRDHIDQTREESPLRKASDAISLENSSMTLDEQDRWLIDQFERVVQSLEKA